MTGNTVSHYRVGERIGGGGMGVVYRAEDVRLGRQVALKFLPDRGELSALALERFRREARAASALNHPHICTIHDVGEYEGRPFLVMELLDGQTLKDLALGPSLPLDQALTWAVEITDALDAAHRKGIIHRDIKPANIFITTRQQAKVLDFGLAKLIEDRPLEGESSTDTVCGLAGASVTRAGLAVGTIHYMSPEQALGEELDARTDVFSFGIVLYELVTGRQPFAGSTSVAVLDAIINRMPEPPARLNAAVPLELERIIAKALEKDRTLRHQSMADLLADLRRLKRDSTATAGGGTATTRPVQRAWPARLQRSLMILAFVVSMVAAAFWWGGRAAPSPGLEAKQLTANPTELPISGASLSPDGRFLAFSDARGIVLQRVESGETQLLPDTAGMRIRQWSADGTRLRTVLAGVPAAQAYWSISVFGVPSRVPDTDGIVSPDGSLVLHLRMAREFWIEGPAGQNPRLIAALEKGVRSTTPVWSPDGKRFAYVKVTPVDNATNTYAMEMRDLGGGAPVTLVPALRAPQNIESAFVWLPDDRIIFSWQEPPPSASLGDFNLWQVRADRAGSASPTRLTNWTGALALSPSASADGRRMSVLRATPEIDVYVGRLEANGSAMQEPTRLTLDDRSDEPTGWTHDATAVLFSSNRSGTDDVYKQALDSSQAVLLAGGPEHQWSARAEPGGDGVFYMAHAIGQLYPARLMYTSILGGPSQEVLSSSTILGFHCSRGGLCVMQEGVDGKREIAISSFDRVRGRGPELFRRPAVPEVYVWMSMDVSPDAARLAYVEAISGSRIRVVSRTGEPERDIVIEGYEQLNAIYWSADGSRLFVGAGTKSGGSALLSVDLQGRSRTLWEKEGKTLLWGVPSPDGTRLAIFSYAEDSNAWLLENF
jgi:Tol biopolymer transport system component